MRTNGFSGTGSILDAMRLGLPLIVVPNERLLDNHQEDLALELERQGYVTKSSIKYRTLAFHQVHPLMINRELPKAIERCLNAPYQGSAHLQPANIGPILHEVMGYEADPRSRLD